MVIEELEIIKTTRRSRFFAHQIYKTEKDMNWCWGKCKRNMDTSCSLRRRETERFAKEFHNVREIQVHLYFGLAVPPFGFSPIGQLTNAERFLR